MACFVPKKNNFFIDYSYEEINSEDEWLENVKESGNIDECVWLNVGEDFIGVVGDRFDVHPSHVNDDDIDEDEGDYVDDYIDLGYFLDI